MATIRFGVVTVVFFVLLRVGLGWHFLHEGLWKYDHPDASAEPFLRQSRGPLAAKYRELIPDYYGQRRLDVEATSERFEALAEQAGGHYGFDGAQRQRAEQVLEARTNQVKEELAETVEIGGKEKSTGLAELREAIEAWREAEQTSQVHDVPYQAKRHWDRWKKLQADARLWTNSTDAVERGLLTDLRAIPTSEQLAAAGEFEPEPTTSLPSLESSAKVTLVVVGLCLMLGLFTRLAAVAGAVFLLLGVVLPQLALPGYYPLPPPSAGHALLVNKEVIEMFALLALATTAVGRIGGLDYFVHHFVTSRLFRTRSEKDEPAS